MSEPTKVKESAGNTPRTDDLLLGLYGTERVEAEKIVNEFARQLERELIQARAAALRDKSVRNDAETVANSALQDMKNIESERNHLRERLGELEDRLARIRDSEHSIRELEDSLKMVIDFLKPRAGTISLAQGSDAAHLHKKLCVVFAKERP